MALPEEARDSMAEAARRLQVLEAALEPLLSAPPSLLHTQARSGRRWCWRCAPRLTPRPCAQLPDPLERAQVQLTLAHAATVAFTGAPGRCAACRRQCAHG